MIYYYCHHESECIWYSNNPNEAEELVEEIDANMYNRLNAIGYRISGKKLPSMTYAGIGARKTPPEILTLMAASATLLGNDRYICCTGAAIGADQAFANGAHNTGGMVSLYLPWYSYESDWVNSIRGPLTKVDTLKENDIDAITSVYEFHPAANNLSQGVLKLHARNYLIIINTDFVICWTPNGKTTGGTGQGIKIAQSIGIPIYNLGDTATLTAFQQKINERENELP